MYNKNVDWEAFDDEDNEMIDLGMSLLESYLVKKPIRPNPDFIRSMFIDEFEGFEEVEGDVKNAIVVKAMERWEVLHPEEAAKSKKNSEPIPIIIDLDENDNDVEEDNTSAPAEPLEYEDYLAEWFEKSNERKEAYDKIIAENGSVSDKVQGLFSAFVDIVEEWPWSCEYEDEYENTPVPELYGAMDRLFSAEGIAEEAVRRSYDWSWGLYDGGAAAVNVTVAWMDDDGLHQEKVHAETAY